MFGHAFGHQFDTPSALGPQLLATCRKGTEAARNVGRAQAARTPSARPFQRAAISARIRFDFIAPICARLSYQSERTNWTLRIQLPIGSHVSFHCDAGGKIYLANLSRPERKRLINVMGFDCMTARQGRDCAASIRYIRKNMSHHWLSMDRSNEFPSKMQLCGWT